VGLFGWVRREPREWFPSDARARAVARFMIAIPVSGMIGGPLWPLPSKFLTGAAAAGGIALINSLAKLSAFAGPYVIGLLNGASGNFRSGLLLLAFVPLAGMALAQRLRHAAVLGDMT
jgi:hypothetical protein